MRLCSYLALLTSGNFQERERQVQFGQVPMTVLCEGMCPGTAQRIELLPLGSSLPKGSRSWMEHHTDWCSILGHILYISQGGPDGIKPCCHFRAVTSLLYPSVGFPFFPCHFPSASLLLSSGHFPNKLLVLVLVQALHPWELKLRHRRFRVGSISR